MLARLMAAGLPIPDGVVLLPAAFDPSCNLKPAAQAEIERLLPSLFPGESAFAVRSSAADEDGAEHSLAGQLDSHLDVSPAFVPSKAEQVARSGRSPRIMAYRAERGLPPEGPMPAVLIQPMIAARSAGVAFSADPVSGRRSDCIVAAVHGNGEKLVSGASDAETWRVPDEGTPTCESQPAHVPVLTPEDAARVAHLARDCQRHAGPPQDIEWAMDASRLWLLQSRPITTLASRPDPDGEFRIWDNSNIAESYNGVTTVLTYSFVRHVYEQVYQRLLQLLGVRQKLITGLRPDFARLLGFLRGRIYYDLIAWNRFIALLPGFSFNRKAMEGMMGVQETMPPEGIRAIEAARPEQDRLVAAWGLTKAAACMAWHLCTLPRTAERFQERLDSALAEPAEALADLRLDQLAARYRDLERRLLDDWDAPLVNDLYAMIFFGALRGLTQRWTGVEHLHNDLVCADGCIISAEPAKRMRHLASLAAAAPFFAELLRTASLADIQAAMPEHAGFATAYAAYVERFGERCIEELKLETATLADDPLPLLRSVGELALRPPADAATAHARDAQALKLEAEAAVAEKLKGKPFRRLLLRFVINQARARIRMRENLRFERTRLFGRVRRIFLAMGRRLHEAGRLADPRDVFHLETTEILGFVEGTATSTDLAALAALRKAEYDANLAGPKPGDRIYTRGAVHVGNDFAPAPRTPTEADALDTRKGLGCSPGTARGPARVVLDPRNARIVHGEILVAPRTDPGWILLFPPAAGLVVEHGSMLSHSAIVSRELGLPCVISLAGASTWIATGDIVELDGSTGQVRIVERAAAAPEGQPNPTATPAP